MKALQCENNIDVGYINEYKDGCGYLQSATSDKEYYFIDNSFIKPEPTKIWERATKRWNKFPDTKSLFLFIYYKNAAVLAIELRDWKNFETDYNSSDYQTILKVLNLLKHDLQLNHMKYINIEDVEFVKLLADVWFQKELGPEQFYEWYDNHKTEPHQERILDVFVQWYADQLIANDFKNKEWEKLLKHISGEPHYHPRGVIPYSLFEGYDKWQYYNIGNDFSYNSDRYPTYKYLYAYDLYKTLIKKIDYRHPFTKEKVEETISVAKSNLQFCHFENDEGRTRAYYRGSLKNVLRGERKLLLEHVENVASLKEKYAHHQIDNVEYCKKAILLWKEFIETYERWISELLTASSPDDAAYSLRMDPEE